MTPGYPPHHPGLHPTQSSMSRGTGASIATTPGSIGTMDDDKGRGSYKCGRCGVPKKGHICPYQPKVKRKSDDPPPDMKCVSTQVEMDEFMTLRRLNIEIQGFPESYAAEPSDNCGTEVHPPPPPHHAAAMTPSSQHGPPSAGPPGSITKAGMMPTSLLNGPAGLPPPVNPTIAMSTLQGPPTSLPSLSSMASQPPHLSTINAAIGAAQQQQQKPEQINSSAASFKTDTTKVTAAGDANVNEEVSPATETKTSNEKEETKGEDSTTKFTAEEELEEKSDSKPEDDNKDAVITTTEETDADNAQKSDDDVNKKRDAEEKAVADDNDESPAKKQKV